MSNRTCTVDGCELLVLCRGWCPLHYGRWRLHGDPAWEPLAKGGPCSVDGCERVVLARGWCSLHYHRWKNHGDPNTVTIRTVATCVIDGCERRVVGRGWCRKHYQRWYKHGDPLVTLPRSGPSGPASGQWVGDAVGYRAMHNRIASARGRAAQYRCQHCGSKAQEWAYDHADPDERYEGTDPYSVHIEHYMPLCKPCHGSFDKAHARDRRNLTGEQSHRGLLTFRVVDGAWRDLQVV